MLQRVSCLCAHNTVNGNGNTQRPDTVFVCNCVSGRCKCHLVFFPQNVAVCVGQDATAMTDFL